MQADDERVGRAKAEQDYDPDPPKCVSCVYFKRQPLVPGMRVPKTTRTGRVKMVKVSGKDTRINPVVDRCTFGNFLVNAKGVCDEWHGRDGSRVAEPD